MSWTPVVRLAGPPRIREHRLDAALVIVAVELSRAPPEDWVAAFQHPPGPFLVLHELVVAGKTVTFTAEKGADVSSTLTAFDERIRAANLVLERNTAR